MPAQVVLRLFEAAVPEGERHAALEVAQVSTHLPRHVRNGQVKTLSVEQADRIIVCVLGDVSLWWTVPELREIHEQSWD